MHQKRLGTSVLGGYLLHMTSKKSFKKNDFFEKNHDFYQPWYFQTLADSDQAFVGGGSQIGEARQKDLRLLKKHLRQSLGVTQKWLPFVGQKVAIFVGRTMRFFRE